STTAHVTLPGREEAPLEVGAGTHHWSYVLPGVARPALSLDSTVAELIDDAQAWAAVLQRLPELARLEGGLQGQAGMALRQVLAIVPDADAARAALEE